MGNVCTSYEAIATKSRYVGKPQTYLLRYLLVPASQLISDNQIHTEVEVVWSWRRADQVSIGTLY